MQNFRENINIIFVTLYYLLQLSLFMKILDNELVMMAMLVTLIFVLLKAGLGRGLSLSLTILCSVQMFY